MTDQPKPYRSRHEARAAREDRRASRPQQPAAPDRPSSPAGPPPGGEEGPGRDWAATRRAGVPVGYAAALAAAALIARHIARGGILPSIILLVVTAVAAIGFAAWRGSQKKDPAEEGMCLRRGFYAAGWLVPAIFIGLPALWEIGLMLAPAGFAAIPVKPRPEEEPAEEEPEEEPEPLAIEPPAPEPDPEPQVDPRQARLAERVFTGQFAGAELWGFHELGDPPGRDGWQVKFVFPEDGTGTVSDLINKRLLIARLFDTTARNVAVDHDPDFDPLNPSERHGEITVTRNYANTAATAKLWDPRVSTYDWLTGAFEIGDFTGGAPGHWGILKPPRGGATGGLIAGLPGLGKTTAANIIMTQSGLIMDDGRRLCGLLIGDPQKMPFATWRTYADVTAVGPKATLHLLRMAAAISRSRADWIGSLEFTDARGRTQAGRGWWEASRKFPAIGVVIDEIPMITGKERGEDAKEAIELMSIIVREARKTGVYLLLLTQTPDLVQLGAREIREILAGWNVLAFRCDPSSGEMIGIKADPTLLPHEKGLAYFASPDLLPSTQFRLRWLEENAITGPDVRELVEIIAASEVDWDEGFLRVMTEMGFPGSGWVIFDKDVPDSLDADAQPAAGGPALIDLPPPGTPVQDISPGLDHARQEVTDYLIARGGPVSVQDIVKETGLSYGAATQATAILSFDGLISAGPNGTWSALARRADRNDRMVDAPG